MPPKATRILGYLSFAVGIGLFTSMTTILHRDAQVGIQYREAIEPYIPEKPAVWSGTSEDYKQFDVLIPADDQLVIRSLQRARKPSLDPDHARWILFAGVGLLIFGSGLMRANPQKTNAEQAGDGDA